MRFFVVMMPVDEADHKAISSSQLVNHKLIKLSDK
jgi:hypothetical protein